MGDLEMERAAPHVKYLLWSVFAASRGGLNRIRIMSSLRRIPRNANQLSEELELNYKAVQHHLGVLERNNLITRFGEKYGIAFFVSPFFESNIGVYDQLVLDICGNKNKVRRWYVR